MGIGAPGAARDHAPGPTGRPFARTEAACARLGLRPGALGPLVGAAIFSLFLAVEWMLGREPIRFEPHLLDHSGEALITLLLCALLAYLIPAGVSAAQETPRAVRRLRPLLRGNAAALAALEQEATERPRGALVWGGVVGAAVALLLPFLEATPEGFEVYDPRHWNPESTWHRFLAPVVGWWMGRLLTLMLVDSVRLSRLAARLERVDLLDRRPLQPFVRFGLANVLRVTGFVALFSFLLIDLARYADVVASIALLTVGTAVAALLLPVRGVHRRLREAKAAELDALHAAIRGDDAAVARTGLDGRADRPSLADLVAYRGLIADAHEWPFDAPAYLRFTLYLAIPVGSWLGGALVERLVDAALR